MSSHATQTMIPGSIAYDSTRFADCQLAGSFGTLREQTHRVITLPLPSGDMGKDSH